MVANKKPKRRGITLNSPEDCRRLIRRIIDKAFAEDSELQYSGRISQLLSTWIKSYELDKLDEYDKRLTALEGKYGKP